MDILEKIDTLRKERGWTIYKLAENAGVIQSTLSNMFTRKTLPSITTLTLLCDAFGITLAEFFKDDNINVPIDELTLISSYRKLSNDNKVMINELLKLMTNKKTN